MIVLAEDALLLLEGFGNCTPNAAGTSLLHWNEEAPWHMQKTLMTLMAQGLIDVKDGWAKASLKGERLLKENL